MKRILAILMAFVMIFCITGCKNKAKTKTNESKPKTTQTTVKKTEEKDKTEKEDASDKEDTEDTEQTDDEDQKSDDGETKQEAKQTSNTGTSENDSTGNSGGNQSGGSNSGSGNTASTTQKPETTTTTQAPTPQRDYGAAATFLSLLNSYRASLGLSQLGVEGFMQEFAMLRANEIINDYSHNTAYSAVAGCPIVQDQYGDVYKYNARGECIYGGAPLTPNDALAGFKASPGHNSILTFSEATHVGVGVVSYNGDNYYCVVTYSDNQHN